MKNIVLFLTLSVIFTQNFALGHDCVLNNEIKKTKTLKELRAQKADDIKYKNRLNLSEEQVQALKEYRTKHKKEMEKIIKRMQVLHDEIRDVYLLGLPKFQTDIRTASQKAELVLLKQNAKNLKKQYRNQIINCLNEKQKIEFLKIMEEKKESNKKTGT